jgi:hypothetical protein
MCAITRLEDCTAIQLLHQGRKRRRRERKDCEEKEERADFPMQALNEPKNKEKKRQKIKNKNRQEKQQYRMQEKALR